MRLQTVLVFVPDLDEARAFYADVLGLALLSASKTLLRFDLGAVALHVFSCVDAAPAGMHAQAAGTAIAFGVASLETEMTRLKQKGVVFLHTKPGFNRETGERYAAFKGPGGNVHELVEQQSAIGHH